MNEYQIAGFILNKLYSNGWLGRTGNSTHGAHTSVENLPKGAPKEDRGKFDAVANSLKKQNLIILFPSNGEYHVCANLDELKKGLPIANDYRASVGLPFLTPNLRSRVHKL